MCNAECTGTPLEELLEAIQRYVQTPGPEQTPMQLGDHLISLRHGIDVLELSFGSDAAVFASTDEYEVQGSVSPIDWIRHHCKMGGHAAARALLAGEMAGRLQATTSALAAGEIGFGHFALLAGVARSLTKPLGGVDPDTAVLTDPPDPNAPASDLAEPGPLQFDEHPLLELARQNSVGLFGEDCKRARHAHDAAAVLDEHVSAAERNRCEFVPCENGFMAVRGYFDPIAAATIKTAVLPLAKPSGYADQRRLPRRLADALVEVASHALDLGVLPSSGGESTHFQLTASVETVMGLIGSPGGELEHAGLVPAATVQRLVCDARIRRILLGPKSAVIDAGRNLRLPSAAARAALRVRSAGCDWPRCDRAVAYTRAHHLVHWGQGGGTDMNNLVLLCYRHHWLVHEGGWQLARVEEGKLLAIPPSQGHRAWLRARGPDRAARGGRGG